MQTRFLKILKFSWKHKISAITSSTVLSVTIYKIWANRQLEDDRNTSSHKYWQNRSSLATDIKLIPKRHSQILKLKKSNNKNNEYDILVIGGGATGSGIALDGVTRGLKVGLIDKCDFASGTSGRSTKLIHGGVRYLEKAITTLDKTQWKLVQEAIQERAHLIDITPHLSYPIPIMIPVYDTFILRGWFNIIKYWVGCKIYEAMAGQNGLLCPSYFLSAPHAQNLFPQLEPKNLIGTLVYFDGQHNDARMNLLIALTASYNGATIANHVEMVDFLKDNNDKIIGIRCRDILTGEEWNTYSKIVINATGPYSDLIRKKDDPYLDNLIIPAQGTHLVLPGTFTPEDIGLLVPKTSDGRVAFMLPWESVTLAGTTDMLTQLSDLPKPTEKEAEEIIKNINSYLVSNIDISDIDAAWSGIRPLARIPDDYENYILNGNISNEIGGNVVTPKQLTKKEKLLKYELREKDNSINTSGISREHLIEILPSGLITITGGKWTTYRKMAEDTIDVLCDMYPLLIGKKCSDCVTKSVKLIGSSQWTHSVTAILCRHQIPKDISEYLSRNYGDKSFIVGDLYLKGNNGRLAGGYPYTEAEVIYCSKYEMAETATDVLSRRTRLALVSSAAAEYALPKVISLMGNVHNWNARTRVNEYHMTCRFLRTMHVKDRHKWGRSRHTVNYARRIVEKVLDGPSMTDEAIDFVINRFMQFYQANELTNKYKHNIDELDIKIQKLKLSKDNNNNNNSNNSNNNNNNNNKQQENNNNNNHNNNGNNNNKNKLFEGCISRQQAFELATEFSQVFRDNRVIDAVMFTGMDELGLYEILVSIAACAAKPEQFDIPQSWFYA